MQIYWNKRKRLHKKRVQLPEDWFGIPTWQPCHCFGTQIWPPWRHVKTLYITFFKRFNWFDRFSPHFFSVYLFPARNTTATFSSLFLLHYKSIISLLLVCFIFSYHHHILYVPSSSIFHSLSCFPFLFPQHNNIQGCMCSIEKLKLSFWNPHFGFAIVREIRKFLYSRWISFRNPNLDFVDFLFYCSIWSPKKGCTKLFSWTMLFFPAYYVCACVTDIFIGEGGWNLEVYEGEWR